MAENGNLPDANSVDRVASKQSLAIAAPGQGQALWRIALGVEVDNFGAQLFHGLLACQIPDLDGWAVGHAQPVAVGRDAQSVDDVVVLQTVQILALFKCQNKALQSLPPEVHKEPSGVTVAVMVILQRAVGQIPELDGTIPAAAHNGGIGVN